MVLRKQKVVSLEEKLDVLRLIDKQPAQKRVAVAKDLGLPPSMLNNNVSKHAEV